MRLSVLDDSTAVEPLTLDDVKQQVKLPISRAHPDDDYIENTVIPAARDRAEIATRRAIRQATYELAFDDWSSWRTYAFDDYWLELPRPPLVEILGVTYIDSNGATVTLATDQYQIDNPTGPRAGRARIAPAFGVSWPVTRDQMNAVAFQYVAGYATSPTAIATNYGPLLPALLKQAMLMDAATLYEHRTDLVVGTIAQEMPRTSTQIYRSFKSYGRWC